MSPARARTRTARSADEGINHEATAPPKNVWKKTSKHSWVRATFRSKRNAYNCMFRQVTYLVFFPSIKLKLQNKFGRPVHYKITKSTQTSKRWFLPVETKKVRRWNLVVNRSWTKIANFFNRAWSALVFDIFLTAIWQLFVRIWDIHRHLMGFFSLSFNNFFPSPRIFFPELEILPSIRFNPTTKFLFGLSVFLAAMTLNGRRFCWKSYFLPKR